MNMLSLPLALVIAAAPPALPAGTYGLVMHFTSEADAPIVGKVTTETTSTALVDVSVRDDGRLFAKQRSCGIVTDGGLFTTRAGPGFLNALPEATYELKVDGDKITGDMGIEAVGVDPKTRTLPTDDKSPAYTDPDGDGHKGAPLDVDVVGGLKFRLDVAQIGHAVLVGTINGNHATGETKVVMSQERILHGLPAFVGQGKKRIAKSTFALEPIPENGTCKDVERLSDVADQAPRSSSTSSTSRT
jgi:hypothetical protein